MIVIKNVVKNEDGSYSSTWNLTEDQMGFLLTFAINTLVAEGLVQIQDNEGLAELETEGSLQ